MKADCQKGIIFYETGNLEIKNKAKGINEKYLNK